MFWPDHRQFQALTQRDRELLHSTVTPVAFTPPSANLAERFGTIAPVGFIDEQFANRSCALLDLVKAVRQHPLVERVVEKLRLELGRVDALPSGRVPGSSGGIARLAMNGRSR